MKFELFVSVFKLKKGFNTIFIDFCFRFAIFGENHAYRLYAHVSQLYSYILNKSIIN